VILLTICLVIISFFLSLELVRTVIMGISTAIKLTVSIKIFEVVLIRQQQVCCQSGADPDNCPLWMNKIWWIVTLLLAAGRIAAVKYIDKRKKNTDKTDYKVLNTEESKSKQDNTHNKITPAHRSTHPDTEIIIPTNASSVSSGHAFRKSR
jgi:hypothetical protein